MRIHPNYAQNLQKNKRIFYCNSLIPRCPHAYIIALGLNFTAKLSVENNVKIRRIFLFLTRECPNRLIRQFLKLKNAIKS